MKLIETNSDGRYGYEGVQVKAEPTPSSQRVEEAIRQLEIGWLEAMRIRAYYAWRRNQIGRVFWISLLVLLIGWCGWTLVDAAFDWLWKGLGTR